MHQQVAEV